MQRHFIKEKAAPLLILAGLAIVAYLPALTQPFISDDYPGIRHSLHYGPISGWKELANDSIERPRATTFVLSYAIYHFFGMRPAAFYSANIFIHILNCWLLFAAGRWRAIGYKLSFWGAAFFAVYEGHSEAIMWFSACNELLMFMFGFLSFVFWLIFLEREKLSLKLRWMWLALSFLSFLPALLSKESSVIFVALFALPLVIPKLRLRQAPYLAPHALICVPYVLSIFLTRSRSLRFHNQSFVLSAPFWVTWTKSYGRMLWFWGFSALISMFVWSRSGRNDRRAERIVDFCSIPSAESNAVKVDHSDTTNQQYAILVSVLWIGIGFVPYMFVDYMHRIPSRQTYLASAGLGWLIGSAIIAMKERCAKNYKWGRPVILVILLLILSHNVVYLWTKKRQQYLKRAEPTERLLSLARSVDGPIYVKCFPSNMAQGHAEAALVLTLNKPADTLIWSEEEARKRPPAAVFEYGCDQIWH
ncbi:MAG: hypothetical protein J2P21_08335 [Chloracidobacterium sp.]|nr:hypothetical protein [Chloracidobacterium sp.]